MRRKMQIFDRLHSSTGSRALRVLWIGFALSTQATAACCEAPASAFPNGIQGCETITEAEARGPDCQECPNGKTQLSCGWHTCDSIVFTCCGGADTWTCSTVTPKWWSCVCICSETVSNKKRGDVVYTNTWIYVTKKDCHNIDPNHTECWCSDSNQEFELNHYFWKCEVTNCS